MTASLAARSHHVLYRFGGHRGVLAARYMITAAMAMVATMINSTGSTGRSTDPQPTTLGW